MLGDLPYLLPNKMQVIYIYKLLTWTVKSISVFNCKIYKIGLSWFTNRFALSCPPKNWKENVIFVLKNYIRSKSMHIWSYITPRSLTIGCTPPVSRYGRWVLPRSKLASLKFNFFNIIKISLKNRKYRIM